MFLRRYGLIISIVCALCACARKAVVCGVQYEGRTPWELAAAIDARGDRSFAPQSVQFIGQSKAMIIGWSLPAEQPDTIFLDLKDGKVTHAILGSEIIDNE